MTAHYLRNNPTQLGLNVKLLLLLCIASGVWGNQVVVPPRVSAVLGKTVTLGCRIQLDSNLSLIQSSWERRLPTGSVTLAVYSPRFGISIPLEYMRRLSFRSPFSHDATIILEDVGFADIGVYTCKVSTFPLGNMEASTTISILVEPKVYISASSSVLTDGDHDTIVATCIAERARPPADVSWETDLYGTSEAHMADDANGTTTTRVHYSWQPTRHAQEHTLTCVVRHPALESDFRIPYIINVQFAPDIPMVLGNEGDFYVGRENVQLKCQANANPPAHHFKWIRLDGDMPDGVETIKNSLIFFRPLQRNDSGVYRCEVGNDIGLRSRDIRIHVQDPPSTTPVLLLTTGISVTALGNKQSMLFTSPTLAPLHEGSLGCIVSGVVVVALFLLMVLGWICYKRQTFCGVYYVKQYHGPLDVQEAPQPDELQQVCSNEAGRASPDSKVKPSCDDDYVLHTDGSMISSSEWYI